MTPSPLPRLRVLRSPQTEPLPDYGNDREARPIRTADLVHPTQGTLALKWTLPSGLPATPEPPRHLRLVTSQAARPADLPDPNAWAAAFAQAAVEVMEGHRPASQLVRLTTSEVYADARRRGELAQRQRLAQPSRGGIRQAVVRALVRSVHVFEPAEGVAEVTAVVRRGSRVRALALRLEAVDTRWRCTALELV
jgi:hypothetical protein